MDGRVGGPGWPRRSGTTSARPKSSHELRDGVAALVERCTILAGRLMASEHTLERVARGGRKAHRLGEDP
ncbi:MAG TPA: hypothetical protein VJ648_10025 [Vicinamibacteria bacterium]|nr:hypothetical protein [Vicinamibacteria bacterium]